MSTPMPQEVLAVFAELTGISFRYTPDSILRQAAEFAKVFTFAEMEAVIVWTRKQQAAGKVNFNAQSFGWLKLMGAYGANDSFAVFQERLGNAQRDWKEKRFRYVPSFRGNERISREERTAANAANAAPRQDEAERERIRKQGAEALKQFLQK